jgi:hypothetical protein
MSTLYPRTISVRRQSVTAQFGTTAFGGDAPTQETIIASGVPASIQYERFGRGNEANLPTDSRRSAWLILIPLNAVGVTLGTIIENDIIADDLGKRYQVYASDYQPLGYNLHAELLTV